jgi:glycosyltransferase involved in cell wall biosynthesis
MENDRKHILLLSSWYPNRSAPFLGNFVQRQAEILAKDFRVTVLHVVADSTISEREWHNTERENLTEKIIYHPKGTHFFSRKKERDAAFLDGLQSIEKVDLIHGHVLLPNCYLFLRAKNKFNCPLIITEHGSYFRKEKRKKWDLKEKFLLKIVRKNIDQLVAVSEVLRQDLQVYFNTEEIATIPNPTNTTLFFPTEKTKKERFEFLHISTLDTSVKNPVGILDAIQLLHDKGYSNFTLTIISDESSLELQKIAKEKDIEELVKFVGPRQQKELVSYYQKSDAFVLFSDYETFSIVLTEAWACGIPTITTPVGIAQHMPEYIGLAVKQKDSLGLAIALEKVLNGMEFDSNAIREYAMQFSDETVLQQLKNLYQKFNG